MFEGPLQRVIDELSRLPGIGGKTAQRLAFHLLTVEEADARRLSAAIGDMRDQVTMCHRCFNVASGDLCVVCRDPRREATVICVVERPQDIAVLERTQEFRGTYHVLGGSLSPINGVGPGQLRFDELKSRLGPEGVTELIVATNPTVEGDATAMYIAREFKPLGVRVTRLASGLPVGGDLDYADELTLGRALVGRSEL
ncbi:MAG: recombination mediator RecR [Actinobacteria bacterium]|nr:recombination mediator RecR [Actinomycetota bacterium]MCI0678443.1 recombination mediator RecR [Actinomycetota bacterium]